MELSNDRITLEYKTYNMLKAHIVAYKFLSFQ